MFFEIENQKANQFFNMCFLDTLYYNTDTDSQILNLIMVDRLIFLV